MWPGTLEPKNLPPHLPAGEEAVGEKSCRKKATETTPNGKHRRLNSGRGNFEGSSGLIFRERGEKTEEGSTKRN